MNADDGDARAAGEPHAPIERATDSAREDATIVRFRIASRVAHWVLGVPFLLLLATGLLLFVPEIKAHHLGGFRVVPLVHVLVGIAFIVALVLAYIVQPDRRSLDSDLGQLFRVSNGDSAWFRHAGYSLLGARLKPPQTRKFNAGQKVNTLASAIFTAGLILSGAVLGINYFTKSVFGSAFVEQVYPFHDFFTIVAVPIVAGHIYLATINPSTRPSFRGMLDGRVRREWARAHHSLWVDECEREDRRPDR